MRADAALALRFAIPSLNRHLRILFAMNASRLFTALPLIGALALAACNDTANGTGEETGALSGEPVAAVPAPEGTSWTETVQVTDEDGYLLGNPDAPIKVVEYASLTCGACAAFAQNGADRLKEDYVSTGRVSFELRNLVRGPDDLILARLARCGTTEAFHPLSDQVWKNFEAVVAPVYQRQEAFGQALSGPENRRMVDAAEVAGYYDFFAQRGVSEDQARACLADFSSLETIAQNSQQQADELGVTGTPTFFVNGQRIEGITFADLEPVLQEAGAR